MLTACPPIRPLVWMAVALSVVALATSAIAATYFEQGEAARRDGKISDAFKLQREGAERGDPDAQWMLAKMYAFGIGVNKNQERSQFWKRKAAEQGEPAAQASVGIDLLEGKPEPRANAEAAYWCRQATELDDPDGQACLGKAYDQGRGVFQDSARAAEWLRKSAAQRNPSGMIGLGILYAQGRGVAQDNVEALKWLFAARDTGPVATALEAAPTRVYDAELRNPQTWIASVQRLVGQAQIDHARRLAREVLASSLPARRPAPPDGGLGNRAFCGDGTSIQLAENAAGLKAMSETEKLIWKQQVVAQQIKFFTNGRAVLIQDEKPKFLCTFASDGRSVRLSCPLSAYEVSVLSNREIHLKAAGANAFAQINPLVQRMRSDVNSCRTAN